MKYYLLHFKLKLFLLACANLMVCTMLLSCGITAFAAEEGSPDLPQTQQPIEAVTPSPSNTEDMKDEPEELYPADVQTIKDDESRQIVKIYVLTAGQHPSDIPRHSFERDGWRYSITDITEKRMSSMDTRSHTETVEINTDSNDLNAIVKQLSPTMDYETEDGYHGVLKLDITSVICEAAGHRNSSYTISATREYPNLSSNDLSLVPKTITDNGRTLQLDTVSWEAQHTVNVDYYDIPNSYRASAKYTATASRSVVTGYITTAEYSGDITKTSTCDTVYTAYFEGKEINPAPKPMPTPEPTATPDTTVTLAPITQSNSSLPFTAIIAGLLGALAAFAGVGAYFFLRRNVKVYRDSFRVLVAKDKISAKSRVIDLSPLEGECFGIEIDRFTAKSLNGQIVEVRHGKTDLKHKIAYEGNTYRIEVNFGTKTIQGIY